MSGVTPRVRRLEEGVRQIPHPHRQGLRLPGRLTGVHHGAEEGLQLSLRVTAHVHDLLPRRGRASAAVRVHVARKAFFSSFFASKQNLSIKKVQPCKQGVGGEKRDDFVYAFLPSQKTFPHPNNNNIKLFCPPVFRLQMLKITEHLVNRSTESD